MLENDSKEFQEEFKRVINDKKVLHTEELYKHQGNYMNMEVGSRTNNGRKLQRGVVRKRALGPQGHLTGNYNDDPLRDISQYNVEFSDSEIKVDTTNIIA